MLRPKDIASWPLYSLKSRRQFSMESMKSFANLGFARLKAAAEVTDPWSFISHIVKQGSCMTQVGEQMISDAMKIRALGANFINDAQAVAQEEARAIRTAAAGIGKAASKKAA